MKKLTPAQHQEIIEKYNTGRYSQRALAKEYDVSYASIMRILRPDYYAKEKEKNRIRMGSMPQPTDSLKQYSIKLNPSSDAAVIEKLESVYNRNDYLRQLVLKDIQNSQEEK